MSDEQLNENLIKLELQGICQDCIYLDKIVPIIREMLSEEYKTGLEQSRFDKNMLEIENQKLKKQLEERPKEYVFIGNAQNKTRDFINQIIKENREHKEAIDKVIECISELDDNTDDTTCYDIDKDTRDYILSILKEVE